MDNSIQGFFLVDGQQYKFIVTRGIHRIAVMKYLGVKSCLLHLDKNYVPIINKKDASDWFFVKNKFISEKNAIKIFHFFCHTT